MEFDEIELERLMRLITISDESSLTHATNRPYYFVIFNNRKWSDHFQRRRTQEMQQQQHSLHPNRPTSDAARQLSLDDHFSLELQKLVTQYIQHTTRPFPLKFFVDLTDPKR